MNAQAHAPRNALIHDANGLIIISLPVESIPF